VVYGRIILTWALKKYDMAVWLRFIWLGIGHVDGCSGCWNEDCGYVDVSEILDELSDN
jgi:hypothetical protein